MLLRMVLVVSCVVFLGCNGGGYAAPKGGKATSHGHDHDSSQTPADFAKSLTELKKLSDNILKAGSANKIDDAHDDLHEVGHLLEAIESGLVKQNLPQDKLETAKKAAAALFTAFGAIDETMHDESKSIDFSKLKPEIEKAMSDLMEATK